MKVLQHFWRGVASVLVLSPTRGESAIGQAPALPTEEEAWAEDARQLAGDWQRVCGDMRAAFERERATVDACRNLAPVPVLPPACVR